MIKTIFVSVVISVTICIIVSASFAVQCSDDSSSSSSSGSTSSSSSCCCCNGDIDGNDRGLSYLELYTMRES